MSHTSKAIEYMLKLDKTMSDEQSAMNFFLDNIRHLDPAILPGNPDQLSEKILDYRINSMNKANPELMAEVNKEIQSVEVGQYVDGLKFSEDMTPVEKRQLQSLAVFNERFCPERSVASQIRNAAFNIEHSREGRSKDPDMPHADQGINGSVMYSMTFGNGQGWSPNEPGEDKVAVSLAKMPEVAKLMNYVADNYDLNLSASGRGVIGSIKDRLASAFDTPLRKAAAVAMPVMVALSVYSMSASHDFAQDVYASRDSSHRPEAQFDYTPSSKTSLSLTVREGDTLWDVSKEILKESGMSYTDSDISKHLAASGVDLGDPNRIMTSNLEPRLLVPSNATPDAVHDLSRMGSIMQNGNVVIVAPSNEYKYDRDEEPQGPSM